ncbi:hypothetical protein [Solidesulfovibrio sp.]|uniref:hypothetical protein n=1 Tax=Solidesulfovibrio sp. TaxID=2910990 RepID=UPI002601E739|nr:hypothetical protein [Solidesulfovibrio sp.]
MLFDNYAAASRVHVHELLTILSADEINGLRETCRRLGQKGVQQWYGEHFDLVLDYVRATPSERKRKKAWQVQDIKGILVLVSSIHAAQARGLLKAITNRVFAPGLSYRETTALAGEIYLDVLMQPVPYWPFDPPDPFAE